MVRNVASEGGVACREEKVTSIASATAPFPTDVPGSLTFSLNSDFLDHPNFVYRLETLVRHMQLAICHGEMHCTDVTATHQGLCLRTEHRHGLRNSHPQALDLGYRSAAVFHSTVALLQDSRKFMRCCAATPFASLSWR